MGMNASEDYPLTESQKRCYEKLYHDLGDAIIAALEDADVQEIMLNPDGGLWLDHRQKGQVAVGSLPAAQRYSILHTLAVIHNVVVSSDHPCLEVELPPYAAMRGQRFTGQIPPIVAGPCFTIRKKSKRIFTLADYVATGRLQARQARLLSEWVAARKNILVCGGPGSGKTTVTNTLIGEAVTCDPRQRFLLLEDTPELECRGMNKLGMLTSGTVKMTQLLRMAMRMRPDRIIIGEVRGGEALDMLKAWNTGCPGGICTVHANGAREAVQRILDLALEAGITVAPVSLVLHTVDILVSVKMRGNEKGFIQEILALGGYDNGTFTFNTVA
jgi:P-type conjugative transfer ATPase TrbB